MEALEWPSQSLHLNLRGCGLILSVFMLVANCCLQGRNNSYILCLIGQFWSDMKHWFKKCWWGREREKEEEICKWIFLAALCVSGLRQKLALYIRHILVSRPQSYQFSEIKPWIWVKQALNIIFEWCSEGFIAKPAINLLMAMWCKAISFGSTLTPHMKGFTASPDRSGSA